MSNYTQTVNFRAKDTLPVGDAGKTVRGAELDIEFDAIETAVASKADLSSPTFAGTVVIPTLQVTGSVTSGTIDGGTY